MSRLNASGPVGGIEASTLIWIPFIYDLCVYVQVGGRLTPELKSRASLVIEA